MRIANIHHIAVSHTTIAQMRWALDVSCMRRSHGPRVRVNVAALLVVAMLAGGGHRAP